MSKLEKIAQLVREKLGYDAVEIVALKGTTATRVAVSLHHDSSNTTIRIQHRAADGTFRKLGDSTFRKLGDMPVNSVGNISVG